MRLYALPVFILTLGLFSFSLPIFSANLAFLYDTPDQYFNEQDWKMFQSKADDALNTLPNGKSQTWKNPATGNGGVFMPLNSIKKNKTICRDLQITNYAHHRKNQYVFMFCKVGSEWKVQTKPI